MEPFGRWPKVTQRNRPHVAVPSPASKLAAGAKFVAGLVRRRREKEDEEEHKVSCGLRVVIGATAGSGQIRLARSA